jgi:hypothetical protein
MLCHVVLARRAMHLAWPRRAAHVASALAVPTLARRARTRTRRNLPQQSHQLQQPHHQS